MKKIILTITIFLTIVFCSFMSFNVKADARSTKLASAESICHYDGTVKETIPDTKEFNGKLQYGRIISYYDYLYDTFVKSFTSYDSNFLTYTYLVPFFCEFDRNPDVFFLDRSTLEEISLEEAVVSCMSTFGIFDNPVLVKSLGSSFLNYSFMYIVDEKNLNNLLIEKGFLENYSTFENAKLFKSEDDIELFKYNLIHCLEEANEKGYIYFLNRNVLPDSLYTFKRTYLERKNGPLFEFSNEYNNYSFYVKNGNLYSVLTAELPSTEESKVQIPDSIGYFEKKSFNTVSFKYFPLRYDKDWGFYIPGNLTEEHFKTFNLSLHNVPEVAKDSLGNIKSSFFLIQNNKWYDTEVSDFISHDKVRATALINFETSYQADDGWRIHESAWLNDEGSVCYIYFDFPKDIDSFSSLKFTATFYCRKKFLGLFGKNFEKNASCTVSSDDVFSYLYGFYETYLISDFLLDSGFDGIFLTFKDFIEIPYLKKGVYDLTSKYHKKLLGDYAGVYNWRLAFIDDNSEYKGIRPTFMSRSLAIDYNSVELIISYKYKGINIVNENIDVNLGGGSTGPGEISYDFTILLILIIIFDIFIIIKIVYLIKNRNEKDVYYVNVVDYDDK